MKIRCDDPLDLDNTLESGQAFRWRRKNDWFYGVIFDNIIRLRAVPDGIEFYSMPSDESTIAPMINHYFRLDDNLREIQQSITTDEHIAQAIRLYPRMRLLRQDPWETLISFIISANSNIPRITTNIEDICKTLGNPLVMDKHVRSTFPNAEVMAKAGEDILRQLGLGFRSKYIHAVAKIIATGDLDLFALREVNYNQALGTLLDLPGVGDKVANCVLLFSLDKTDAFPVDVWIDRVIRELYFNKIDSAPSKTALRPWAQKRFGKYAGYANHYLFHSRRLQDKH